MRWSLSSAAAMPIARKEVDRVRSCAAAIRAGHDEAICWTGAFTVAGEQRAPLWVRAQW